MRICAVLLFVLAPLAGLAQTTIKVATLYPPGSEVVVSLQSLSEQLDAALGGKLTLKVYPGGVMGDGATVLRKIRIGQLQGALVSAATLENLDVDVSDLSDPFQFDSLDQVYQQRDEVDEAFRQRLLDTGWLGFGPLDGGFSYLMSKQKIPTLSALRNAKLWLPNTADIQRMTRELNISYLVMNIGDVLTGLDTGAIDTLIAPPAAALTLNWHSRFNYVTQTPVIYTWGMLLIPEKTLNRLSAQERDLARTMLTEWAANLDSRLRVSNQRARDAIQQLLTPQTFSEQDLQNLRISQR